MVVGALGGAIAGQLQANGFRVTGVRRSGKAHDAVDLMITPKEFLNELPYAEILILTCPLTDETRGLVSSREFAALPPGAGLLKLSHGSVIDHSALVLALTRGRLSGGAILDVSTRSPRLRSRLFGTSQTFWYSPRCQQIRQMDTICVAARSWRRISRGLEMESFYETWSTRNSATDSDDELELKCRIPRKRCYSNPGTRCGVARPQFAI
ncbi:MULTISPECIES: NAD(P)-dependent oxidoreductase [unclassified Neorhizobium]|uniref:NAD(P)-dependent oxidoreductase n=1 Tax=unclassified Neorhizobium TaxID=2629175 RepID=UPI00344EA122